MKVSCGAELIYDAHELETETHSLKGVKKKLAKVVERLFIKVTMLSSVKLPIGMSKMRN